MRPWFVDEGLRALAKPGLALGAGTFVFVAGVAFTAARVLPNPGKYAATVNVFTCTVTGVHDGDGPIYCAEGPKIRLAAIAARELDETCNPGHPCPVASGVAAKQELTRLAQGQRLRCEATGTSYSRVTAWCWRPDGIQLNCAMVRSGLALRWAKFDRERRMCRERAAT